MRALSLSLVLALGIVAFAPAAFADDVPAKPPPKGPTTTATVIIHGRPARPNASITVARVPLEASVRELRQPFVERIAKSVDKSPF
jgi:hypothetical protein